MPVNQKKMAAMKKEYGAKKGKQVYFAMENKAKHASKTKSVKRKTK